MIESYENIIACIEELIKFLKKNGIEAEYKSHLENDYLIAHQFYENYKKNSLIPQDENERAALGGLFELYNWIWSVKDYQEFNKLQNHLKLLVQSAPRINSITPMINPVTNKQDDKTNKFIEAIVGMYAVKVGRNIDLDDPVKSSNGTNPDVLLDYNGVRVAVACKTLRGNSVNTIRDNLIEAGKQINRAECEIGYIFINAMNILRHEDIKNKIYTGWQEPLDILWEDIHSLYNELTDNESIYEIFENNKVSPFILTFIHSVTRISNPIGGYISISLKGSYAYNFKKIDTDKDKDIKFLCDLNEFIHNRLD